MYDDATNEQSGVKPSNSYNSYNYTNYNYSDDKTYNGDLTGKSAYGYGNGGNNYGAYQYSNAGSTMGNAMGNMERPAKKRGLKILVSIIVLLAIVGGIGAGGYLYRTYGKDKPLFSFNTKKTEDTTGANPDNIATTTVSNVGKATVTDVTGVVQEVMPSMVIIHNNRIKSSNFFGYGQESEGLYASGSGIIVGKNDSELLIATNFHVVDGADSIEVIFSDGSSDEEAAKKAVQADLKGPDPEMDLAVIAVSLKDIPADTASKIKVATLGDSNALTLGEPAIAIGNALGYGQSVSTGVISAVNRKFDMGEGSSKIYIQTDAAINPGNSGGALLNIKGEVIGINSIKIGEAAVEGMGYAIPISLAKPKIEELMNQETKKKVKEEDQGVIGIQGISVSAEDTMKYGIPQGVYVYETIPGGGAEKAGIEKGDVIVKFDGSEIGSMEELHSKLRYYSVGTSVNITILRPNGNQYDTIDVTVQLSNKNIGSSDDNNSNAESDSASDDEKAGTGG